MALEKILITEEEKNNMLPCKTYIISFLIITKILENYINYRQVLRLRENRLIPKELISLGLDQSKYEANQKYSLAKTKFKMYSTLFKDFFVLIFLYFNIYPLQYEISKKLCTKLNPENEYGPLIWFVILEIISEEMASLPCDVYETFFLEQKFGFNKSSIKTFIIDQIKTVFLFILFIPILVCLLVYIIIKCGEYFYIVAEIVSIFCLFLFMWIFPNFIQPLFNKFKELENHELYKSIINLAKRVNFPLKKIYEMDQSERSSHSNAYLFGFWKNKRIVLYDTLIKHLNKKEIEAVLSHELGHWAKWHSTVILFLAFTNFFIIFYLAKFFIEETAIFVSFGFEQKSIFIGLFLFFLSYYPVTFYIEIGQNFIVRNIEYQADKYSYDLGYGDLLITSLIKMSDFNKSDLDPDCLYSIVNDSHPTLIQRVRALNEYKNKDKDKEKTN